MGYHSQVMTHDRHPPRPPLRRLDAPVLADPEAKDAGLGVQLIYGSGDPAKPPSTVAHEELVGAELTFTKSF